MGKCRRSVLDIPGQCPGVIHTPLLQSSAKHSKIPPCGSSRDTAEMENKGGMSGMRGQTPYPGERPITGLKPPVCLWHAAQIR